MFQSFRKNMHLQGKLEQFRGYNCEFCHEDPWILKQALHTH